MIYRALTPFRSEHKPGTAGYTRDLFWYRYRQLRELESREERCHDIDKLREDVARLRRELMPKPKKTRATSAGTPRRTFDSDPVLAGE